MPTMDCPPFRPQQPSNAELMFDLGIEPGSYGCKKEAQRRRHQSAVYQQYLADLAAWERDPRVVAEEQQREAEREEFARQRREAEDRRRSEVAQAREQWARLPCRWKRDGRSVKSAAVLTLAHTLAVRGGLKVESSPKSRTKYLRAGPYVALRVSDHELGYSDYGARKQSHRGPEAIVRDNTTTPHEIIADAIYAVREYATTAEEGCIRNELASLLRGLRAARRFVDHHCQPAH